MHMRDANWLHVPGVKERERRGFLVAGSRPAAAALPAFGLADRLGDLLSALCSPTGHALLRAVLDGKLS